MTGKNAWGGIAGVLSLVLSGATWGAENIARGKPYDFSHEPNYRRGTEVGDLTDLTDGRYVPGTMWMNPGSVAWGHQNQSIAVTVDLGKVEPISGFCWSCAGGWAGVNWPDFINVYVSPDRKTWTFVGNLLAKSYARTGAPAGDRYANYRAFSDEMPAVGRYVCFSVYSARWRVCDEIEVYRGPASLLVRPPTGFTTDDPLRHDAFLRTIDPVMNDLARLQTRARATLAPAAARDFCERLDALRTEIGADDGSDPRQAATTVPLSSAHEHVLAANAVLLRQAGFAKPVFWTRDRWENLDPIAIPSAASVRDERLTLELMRGETRSTAINILNPTDKPLPCAVSVTGLPATANVSCREVICTLSRSGSCVSGAIAQPQGPAVQFVIPAGCTKEVWITADRAAGTAGTFVGEVTAVLGGQTLRREIALTLHDCDFPRPRLHVGGWDYLDNRGEVPGCPRESINADLAMQREMFADIAFGTRRVMPKGAEFDADGHLVNPDALDFTRWEKWAKLVSGARGYQIFMRTGDAFEGEKTGTPRFNRMLAEYVAAWAKGLRQRGFDPATVSLGLVDEPDSEAEDNMIIAWATPIRAARTGFQIFTDPMYTDPSRGNPLAYSLCDIICPQVRYMDGDIGGIKSASFYTDLVKRENKTLWLYSCSGPSRELDPITYYRGLCWLAWQLGSQAACYWQFGCGGGVADSWHAWLQKGSEYSPYFVSPDGTRHCHGKQSEGIREGVEDHTYFTMLNDLIGPAKAAGLDTTAAERLLAEGPARGLNQVGRPGAARTTPDSDLWKDAKPRGLMDRVRVEVLREIVRLQRDLTSFDTAGAWVTGVKFAWGANCDRRTPPPEFVVRFAKNGVTNDYSLGTVCYKNRFWMQRRFSSEERRALAGAVCVGFFFVGATDEDQGVSFAGARLFRETFEPIASVARPKRNVTPMPGQDLGLNTGAGTLPFPTREKTIQPIAASAKKPLAVVPTFTGGAVRGAEEFYLRKSCRREGRCLIVDLQAPAGKVTAINTGMAGEAKRVRSIRVPYLPYSGDVEQLEGGLFRYAIFDWYRSNASLFETNANGTITARYRPKTDGSYNPVCERIVITLSDDFDDVLPEIPNPPSPYKAKVGSRLWRSHAASDRARDRAFWKLMHENGIRNVCVMDHETMWRDGGEAFTFTTAAARGRGGDAVQAAFSRFMNDELGYVYGPYNNYTDYQPNCGRYWSVDCVSRESDGSLIPAWLRSYAPKPTAILPLCEKIVPEAQRKFGFCGAYCDVHTAVRPQVRVDFDARCPGAGTVSQVYYAYGELLLRQRELWRGPIWSEGGVQFLYAGLVDGNYAQDYFYDFQTRPWLVDFDLLKIHPLEVDFGMGSLSMFSHPKSEHDVTFYLPGMPAGRDVLVDSFLAATLAYGHNGLLIADWCWKPAKMFGPAYCGVSEETFADGLEIAKRSYFLTQAIAARYTRETVSAIRYCDVAGLPHATTAALLNGAVARRQVYVRYTGGVHVVVNGNARERFVATLGGRAIDLPPYGFLAWTEDGLVESSITGAGATRRYFAKSPDYRYDVTKNLVIP